MSVVGPRYVGKTVFLKALAARAKQDGSPYSIIVYWELGHAPPTSDGAFIVALCDVLRDAMGAASNTDFSEHRGYLTDKTYGSLKEVMDLLESESNPVLMIWDGLDKPLGQGLLTGHLFGQMRDIFHGKHHKIITAARAAKTEIARNKQVYDSEFWNLFDVNVPVGPFTKLDLDAVISKAGLTVTPGGIKEVENWTGNYPPLVLSVFNKLAEHKKASPISNESVCEVATVALDEVGDMLTKLWEEDCTAGARDVYRILITEKRELLASSVGKNEANVLCSRGFAVRDGNKLKPACRLLEVHVQASMPDAGTLARLFGEWPSYRSEIRNVLELRLKQIALVHERLHRLVERSIKDIPEYPDDCLNSLSQIEDLAFDLIWEQECGGSKEIPNDVIAYWTVMPRAKARLINERMEPGSPKFNDWKLSSSRSDHIGFLQLLTGSTNNFDSKAKRVSKDTYVLLNAIHSFRNRNQHPEGQTVHEGVAVAAMMTCVELLSCLARELK